MGKSSVTRVGYCFSTYQTSAEEIGKILDHFMRQDKRIQRKHGVVGYHHLTEGFTELLTPKAHKFFGVRWVETADDNGRRTFVPVTFSGNSISSFGKYVRMLYTQTLIQEVNDDQDLNRPITPLKNCGYRLA